MSQIQVQEIQNLIEDYTSAKTGNTSADQIYRTISTSVQYLQRSLGLASDEKIHSFFYTSDQMYYAAPTDFMEEMMLVYNNEALNDGHNEWEHRAYSELLLRAGSGAGKFWSVTPHRGQWNIMVRGDNTTSGQVISDFDTVGNWEAAGDAANLTQDLLEKEVGDGSISFDITNSTGLARITNDNLSLSVKSLFEKHGYFKVWTFLTDNNIDDIAIKLFVDGSNYWTITVTADDTGAAFAENEWIKLGFALDNAVETGSPEITDTVTRIDIEYDLGTGFTSAADFRVDHLFTAVPDKLDLIYRSNIIATDNTGLTNKRLVTASDDLLLIGAFYPDMADLIARRAALTLFPSLRTDKDFMMWYKSELKELMKTAGMRHPRTRVTAYKRTQLKR